MERLEIPAEGRLSELVDAVERGDEVVLVRDGKVVAAIERATRRKGGIDLEKLKAIHDKLGPLAGTDGAGLVREMREMDDH